MTPVMLQEELMDEFSKLTEEMRFKMPGGGYGKMGIYAQDIPILENQEQEEPFPYLIVRLINGTDSGDSDSKNTVHLVIIIGIWDDALDAQGHRDIMNVVGKIYERFSKNPYLNEKAVYSGGFEWKLQDDAYYPYYFGACMVSFTIPAIRREASWA